MNEGSLGALDDAFFRDFLAAGLFTRRARGELFFGVAFLAAARRGARCTVTFPRDVLAVMNGLGLRPLLNAISSIDRPEATDLSSSRIRFLLPSRANASRCLMSSQLVRFSPSRCRIRVRIQPPLRFSPSRVKSNLPLT